jgi:CubicO group peptidase (beta-lactamase class C family)
LGPSLCLASQSKPLTASALMLLVDEGRVNLDDPVEKYLPEFKDQMLTVEQDRQLTSRQTAPGIKDSYGLGFAVGTDWCGHGGAYATNMQIDRRRGLVFVWMVQHNGFPGNGAKSQDAFKQATIAAFAP